MLKERIRQCADMAGSGDELARLTDIPRRTLESYLSGASEPKAARLADICKAVGVDANWLLTGEGAMRPGEAGGVPPASLDDEFALVTVYDVRASAGLGAAIEEENPVSSIAFRRDWLSQEGLATSGLAAVTADGDSMEPTVKDGSLLLVDTAQSDLAGNRIYVLRMDGHLYAKRLQRLTDGSIRVSSDNPAYADEVVDKDEVSKLDIIGRVVWAGRRM